MYLFEIFVNRCTYLQLSFDCSLIQGAAKNIPLIFKRFVKKTENEVIGYTVCRTLHCIYTCVVVSNSKRINSQYVFLRHEDKGVMKQRPVCQLLNDDKVSSLKIGAAAKLARFLSTLAT